MSDEKAGGSSKPQIQHHKITLPKGGGAISGIGEKFQANAVTGTGTFSVPIPATPSRGGLQPALSLGYDSGSGNGVFGFGWSLDVPNISRKTAQGLPQYLDLRERDTFLLSGAEDLVPLLNADGSAPEPETKVEDTVTYSVSLYRPRIEGLFARIEKWKRTSSPGAGDVHWRATTRDNVTSIYGRSTNTRIADPAKPARVFKWLLEESRDAKANVIRYAYKGEDQAHVTMTPAEKNRLRLGTFGANRHLARISYGIKAAAGGATEFHFHVVLDYGDHPDDPTSGAPPFAATATWQARQDPFSDHRAGFEVRTYRLCQRVLVFHEFDELDEAAPVPVRSLELTYDENPVATKLTAIRQRGYKQRTDGTFESKAFPAVTYTYSEPVIDTQVRKLDPKSLENLPQGLGGAYQWVDLHGEGLSGVLAEQGDAWYYKRNEGDGHFGPMVRLPEKPVAPQLGNRAQLVDIDGDGNTELVVNSAQLAGFYAFVDGRWESFRSFRKRLNLDVDSPWVKQIDLTGDGRPDILLAEDNVFTWHESLGREGYAPARKVAHPLDEAKGPRLIFAEAVQTIFLADMTGDGLTDLVRIRASGICYWPNLGYGKFGPRVVMDNAPVLAPPDLFNPRYVRLGDVDGSGTADLFYFGGKRPKVWLNRAGNGYDGGHELPAITANNLSSVDVIDLLGKGTSCVVWSTQLPNVGSRQMSYVDLMAAGKPHLLTQIDNGMGKVVEITYAPSTEDYLRDRTAGAQWITRLPFPVHVLRQVATRDLVGGTRLDTLYRYHHGYFDGTEREFRGFGMVEALDTETFEKYAGTDQGEHYVTPVLTKTWFHNGAFLKQSTISAQYAKEYFPGVDPENPDVLPDTVIEDETLLPTDERREAYRALKGHTLRQEVWEWDPVTEKPTGIDPDNPAPYSVAESNYTVKRLQPKGEQKHAVFRVDPRETITWHYEQNADDPRVAHDLTLEVDDYGSVLKSCAVVYPRRGTGHPEDQSALHATCAVSSIVNVDPRTGGDFYLIGAPAQALAFEVGGLGTPGSGSYFTLAEVTDGVADALANVIPFEQQLSSGHEARRLSWQRFRYWNAAQDAALPVGQISERALLHHVETAVLTPGLVTQAFGSAIGTTPLEAAGYASADSHWWNPGLVQHYSVGGFYLPVRTEDPFGNSVTVTYDDYALAPVEVADALENTSSAEIDYRTLSPWRLTGPNQNVSEAVTDPLGMVIATSVYGEELGVAKGDLPLSTYVVQADASIANVLADPQKYLQNATTFFFYDLDVTPVRAIGLARETHVRDLGSGETSAVQISLTYSDGFGRELQSKLKAEPGLAWVWNPTEEKYEEQISDPRWLVSGRTVYNNKQKPVKQYEPFYSATADFEPEEFFATYGVTPVIHYDPLLRVIRTDIPKLQQDEVVGSETVRKTYHFFSKVEFTPWDVTTNDANDTVLESEYYALYDTLSADEKMALDKAAAHAGTPSTAHLDTLGRQFRTIQRLKDGDPPDVRELATVTTFDITGKPLTVTDPRGNVAFRYTYDMPGATLRTQSIDAGDDRALANVMGNPVLSFDARGHTISATYDALHRPVGKHVSGNGLDNEVEALEYGEGVPDAVARNLRGQLYRHFDQAGLTLTDLYSIAGAPRQSAKRLRAEYRAEANWPSSESGKMALLEAETFTAESVYDALGRVKLQTNPDTSTVRPEFHQSGRLNKLHVRLNGDTAETEFVTGIAYNPKGQRELIAYGNGTTTAYGYEKETFRLTSLVTTRTSDAKVLQDISYVYDPVGNIVKIRDDSHNRVFTGGGPVDPVMAFAYDALYRLSTATGRTHNALNGGEYKDPAAFKQSRWTALNDLGQVSLYTENYAYDDNGNLYQLQHLGTNNFTRDIVVHDATNRALLETDTFEPDPAADWVALGYFDPNGNQTKFDHLAGATWNYRDNLASATLVDRTSGNDDAEYYVYDAAGQRTRKVKETFESGETVKRVVEKIYLGGVEVKRVKTVDMGTLVETRILDRSDLHVMDDKSRVAIVPRWTQDDLFTEIESTSWLDTNRIRYQYGNHLGSASLELDASGQLISYEEYFPYGGTAFISGSSQAEVKLKEYRYTGKERDDTTSFYYYGARYYAPWVGRWLSADPAGPVDGLNLYLFVRNNPLGLVDRVGKQEEEAQPQGFREWTDPQTNQNRMEFWFTNNEATVGSSSGKVETEPPSIAQEAPPRRGPEAKIEAEDPERFKEGVIQTEKSKRLFAEAEIMWQTGNREKAMELFINAISTNVFEPTTAVEIATIVFGLIRTIGMKAVKLLTVKLLKAAATEGLEQTAKAGEKKILTGVVKEAAAETIKALPPAIRIPIGNAKFGLEHILRRHVFSSGVEGVSKFAQGMGQTEIKALIQEANATSAAWRVEGTSRVLDLDMGRIIGTDPVGKATRGLRVVTTASGDVITAYPIPWP